MSTCFSYIARLTGAGPPTSYFLTCYKVIPAVVLSTQEPNVTRRAPREVRDARRGCCSWPGPAVLALAAQARLMIGSVRWGDRAQPRQRRDGAQRAGLVQRQVVPGVWDHANGEVGVGRVEGCLGGAHVRDRAVQAVGRTAGGGVVVAQEQQRRHVDVA